MKSNSFPCLRILVACITFSVFGSIALDIQRRYQHDQAWSYFTTNGFIVGTCPEWFPIGTMAKWIWDSSPSLQWSIRKYDRERGGNWGADPGPFWTQMLACRMPTHTMLICGAPMDKTFFKHLNTVMGLENVQLELKSFEAIEASAIERMTRRVKMLIICVDANLSSAFLHALIRDRELIGLRLIGTGIEPEALSALANAHSLNYLQLSEAWVDATTLVKLQESLPEARIDLMSKDDIDFSLDDLRDRREKLGWKRDN